MLVIASIASQAYGQSTNAPLYLSINGDGNVSPLTNGELLVVGQTYSMTATPDAGFAFSGWQPVNVFVFSTTTINPDGSTNAPIVSVVRSLVPTYTNQALLNFTMQPVTVLVQTPTLTTTEATGWHANFEPVVLNIQLGDAAVILSWPTNSTGFALQSTTNLNPPIWAPVSVSPAIVSGQNLLTNPISGTQQFFRLSQ